MLTPSLRLFADATEFADSTEFAVTNRKRLSHEFSASLSPNLSALRLYALSDSDRSLLLSSAHAEKPRFLALLTAVLTQSFDLLPLIQSLTEAFNPETAVGPQLDALASQPGSSRTPGESDATLRSRLQTLVLSSHWKGTNESLIALFQTLLPDAAFNDHCDLSVTVSAPSVPVPARIRRLLQGDV